MGRVPFVQRAGSCSKTAHAQGSVILLILALICPVHASIQRGSVGMCLLGSVCPVVATLTWIAPSALSATPLLDVVFPRARVSAYQVDKLSQEGREHKPGPPSLLPLFTGVRGIGILGSSDAGSCIDRLSEARGWPERACSRVPGGLHVVVVDGYAL